MSRGINKVTLIGLVGGEVELRYTQSGQAIVQFSLATGKQWRDRNTQENKESTEWHRCVAFEPLSNVIAEYVKKGYKLYLEGENRTRKWVDQQNITRYVTEIYIHEMEILSSPKGADSAETPAQQLAGQSHTPVLREFGHDPDLDDSSIPFDDNDMNSQG
jgi:single-strand DNA-binding protein